MPDYTKPLPTPDPVTKPYWDSVKAHAMQLQKCAACNNCKCARAYHRILKLARRVADLAELMRLKPRTSR